MADELSPIDQLYKKYPGGYTDYEELLTDLAIINSRIRNPQGNIIYDPMESSYVAGVRAQNTRSSEQKTFAKKELYGVVLKIAGGAEKKVYIDVPPYNTIRIEHPDVFADGNTDLKLEDYKTLVFDVPGIDLLSSPVIRGIAVVSIPDNYPNHTETNLEDAIYIRMYSRTELIRSDTVGQTKAQNDGNGLNAENQPSDAPIAQQTGPIGAGGDVIDFKKDLQQFNGYFYGSRNSVQICKVGAVARSGEYIQVNAAEYYRRMLTAYQNYVYSLTPATAISLPKYQKSPLLGSGTRSMQNQIDIFNGRYVNSVFRPGDPRHRTHDEFYKNKQLRVLKPGAAAAAYPGYSNHQSGLAVDIIGCQGKLGGVAMNVAGSGVFFDWMCNNAWKYGYRRTVHGEAWHWEFRDQWVNNRNGILAGGVERPQRVCFGNGREPNKPAPPVNSTSAMVAQNSPAKPQSIPKPNPTTAANSKSGKSSSAPTNRPRMLLVNFETDFSKFNQTDLKMGAKTIKIREDIKPDLNAIKQYINNYDIPFTCEKLDLSLDNKKISHLSRVGLEIRLNQYSGLVTNGDYEYNDYYIGPDYSKPNGNFYKLKVYGNVRRNMPFFDKYPSFTREIDIYDISSTYLKSAPKIKKIFKPLIDISKIFEDYGFLQEEANSEFFYNSDNLKSNWFIFYKPSKIKVGYSYKELLATVYEDNNETIWKEANLFWNGKKFI